MRKDRVWMKFKKDDFNQLMGVLSKQIERYEEIEAQNLNLKADIQDEKECLLDLQNKIWRYSHFEKESELITMDIRIQKPIIEMSMKQVIFQNMAIKRMKNKSKKL